MIDAFTPALDQAAAIRRGEVSAVELVEMYLRRADRLNPSLNAFRLLTPELALEAASGVQPARSPLAGVATSVKDLVGLAGYAFTYGSRVFEDNVAPVDYFMVGRLKEAGCAILGKTTTPEFGSRPTTEHGLHGTARNPWNPDHNTGGSSGGAAGAVAAGLCAFAHATDGGGSVRIPASWCGLVGLKPSRGRISMGPIVGEGWAGLSTSGVITRTVADAAAALDVMAGHLEGDPYWAETASSFLAELRAPERPLRIAFTTADPQVPVDPEVATAVRAAATLCADLGHQVTEGGPDTAAFGPPLAVLVATGLTAYQIPDPNLLDPINRANLDAGRSLSAADYLAAVNTVRAHSRVVVAFWDGCDVLLTPTMPQTAPLNGSVAPEDIEATRAQTFGFTSFTRAYNCTGQPAISLPLAISSAGLPIGAQLVGRPHAEQQLLDLALQLEQAQPWAGRRAPVEP